MFSKIQAAALTIVAFAPLTCLAYNLNIDNSNSSVPAYVTVTGPDLPCSTIGRVLEGCDGDTISSILAMDSLNNNQGHFDGNSHYFRSVLNPGAMSAYEKNRGGMSFSFHAYTSFIVGLGDQPGVEKCRIHLSHRADHDGSVNFAVTYEDGVPGGCDNISLEQSPNYTNCKAADAPGYSKGLDCVSFFNTYHSFPENYLEHPTIVIR